MNRQRYKGFLLICSLCLILSACANHSDLNKANSTFFVVQPAEHFHGFNGHLNWYGRNRAGDLTRLLKDSGIQRIYATGLAASRETIDSLKIINKDFDVVEFPIDSVAGHLFDLLKEKEDFGKRILIISPENEIDSILRKLGWENMHSLSPKNKFNIMYRLVNDEGKTRLNKVKFGKVPRPIPDTVVQKINPTDSL